MHGKTLLCQMRRTVKQGERIHLKKTESLQDKHWVLVICLPSEAHNVIWTLKATPTAILNSYLMVILLHRLCFAICSFLWELCHVTGISAVLLLPVLLWLCFHSFRTFRVFLQNLNCAISYIFLWHINGTLALHTKTKQNRTSNQTTTAKTKPNQNTVPHGWNQVLLIARSVITLVPLHHGYSVFLSYFVIKQEKYGGNNFLAVGPEHPGMFFSNERFTFTHL